MVTGIGPGVNSVYCIKGLLHNSQTAEEIRYMGTEFAASVPMRS
jgi:hypothetical protein